MNLMFWKKKPGATAEADDAPEDLAVNSKRREALDFVATQQDDAGREMEPSEPVPSGPEEDSQEATAKPGWSVRIRSRLGALTQIFSKPPAFRAEVEPDAPGDAKNPDAAEPVEPEIPPAPGLAAQVKLQLAALVRRFRKALAADAEESQADHADESPAPEAPAKPGLFARIKAGFTAFAREVKAPAALTTAGEDDEDAPQSRSAAEPEDESTENAPPRSKKRLLVGGAIGLLVLLLVGIAIAYWLASEPPEQRHGTRHDTDAIPSRSDAPDPAHEKLSAPALEEPSPEVEALRRENTELQAQIEALRGARQRPSAPPARPYGGNVAVPPPGSGELAVGSEDPKAAAMTLKEAIEAMNATTGDDK